MTDRTVVALRGGLGNQMFQYAAGRVVEERTGAELLLDATLITAEDIRSFELDQLGTDSEVTIDETVDPYTIACDTALFAEYSCSHYGTEALIETGHEFGDELASAGSGSVLYGYWQSERYFGELAGPMRIVSGETSAIDDLGLMARCSHFVIVNSSFSWWGAWLGERPGSVVVTPERWFRGLQLDSSDIAPERWIRL